MNPKEKLIEVMKDKSFIETYMDERSINRLADDILKSFPQIEKKPVKVEVLDYEGLYWFDIVGADFEKMSDLMDWTKIYDVEVLK